MGKHTCSTTIVNEPTLGGQSLGGSTTERDAGNRVAAGHLASVSQGLHAGEDDAKNLCSGRWMSHLEQAYLVGLPTTRGLWNRAAEAMPTEVESLYQQEQMCWAALLSTLLHPLALHFPRDVNHDLATLLWLTETFKKKGWNSDAFVRPMQLCRERLRAGSQQELVYKSYILDSSCPENGTKYWNRSTVDTLCDSFDKKQQDSHRNDLLEQYEQGLYRNSRVPRGSDTNPNILPTSSGVPTKSLNATGRNLQNVLHSRPRDEFANMPMCGSGHITLLEAVDGIARGTTGLTSWGGGAVMAEWLDNNKHLLKGKRVLELGSGVGYLASATLESCCPPSTPTLTEQQLPSKTSRVASTTAGKNLAPQTGTYPVKGSPHPEAEDASATRESSPPSPQGPACYTATDCHPHVLDLLFHNLSLMDPKKEWGASDLRTHQHLVCESLVREELPAGDAPSKPWSPPSELPPIRGVQTKVMYLDWRTPDLSDVPIADVIIAADIVYAKHLLRPLAVLLRKLLSRQSETFNTPTTMEHVPRAGEETNVATNETVRAAYIACTRRNNKTLSDFFSYLHEENLTYSLVYQATLDTESALFVYNESHIPVKVYKVVLSST